MRKLLVCLFALVPLAVLAGPALAHPVPESYDPGDGATLSSAPSQVSAIFNETLNEGSLEVYGPHGTRVGTGRTGGDDGEEQPRSGGGGAPSDDADGTAEDETSSSSGQPDPAKGDGNDEGKKASKGDGKHRRHKEGANGKSKAGDSTDAAGPATASDTTVPPTVSPDQPKDIPVDWMMISFSIAALIGAAGGQIYVNLSGPER